MPREDDVLVFNISFYWTVLMQFKFGRPYGTGADAVDRHIAGLSTHHDDQPARG